MEQMRKTNKEFGGERAAEQILDCLLNIDAALKGTTIKPNGFLGKAILEGLNALLKVRPKGRVNETDFYSE